MYEFTCTEEQVHMPQGARLPLSQVCAFAEGLGHKQQFIFQEKVYSST